MAVSSFPYLNKHLKNPCLRDRLVACSASDLHGSNLNKCNSGEPIVSVVIVTYIHPHLIILPTLHPYLFYSIQIEKLLRFLTYWEPRSAAKTKSVKPGLCPTPIKWLWVFFIGHIIITSPADSKTSNTLEHCICTTSMSNIWTGRDSNPVPSFELHTQKTRHIVHSILSHRLRRWPNNKSTLVRRLLYSGQRRTLVITEFIKKTRWLSDQ